MVDGVGLGEDELADGHHGVAVVDETGEDGGQGLRRVQRGVVEQHDAALLHPAGYPLADGIRVVKEQLEDTINQLCEMTGISPDMLLQYPHELDGGKRQVVGIARALSLRPEFIVCDEPVSALDVSVQAKIINLLMDLQKRMNLSYLFISHDLSVVKHISHRIAVMYLGQIVELASKDDLFIDTRHPYSIALLSAIPKVDVERKVKRIVLKGDVPSPINPRPICRFASRCWMSQEVCFQKEPPLREVSPGHCVACHFADQSREKMKSATVVGIDR